MTLSLSCSLVPDFLSFKAMLQITNWVFESPVPDLATPTRDDVIYCDRTIDFVGHTARPPNYKLTSIRLSMLSLLRRLMRRYRVITASARWQACFPFFLLACLLQSHLLVLVLKYSIGITYMVAAAEQPRTPERGWRGEGEGQGAG